MEIKAKVRIEVDRTVTVQLPEDVPAGEYEAVLVPIDDGINSQNAENQKWDAEQAEAWERIMKGVEQLQPSPQPAKSEYHKGLIEKYRKQGLNL